MENQQDDKSQIIDNNPNWERDVLEKLAFAAVNEQRKTRRWGIFFKFLTFAYLVAILVIVTYPRLESGLVAGDKGHVAVIDVQGMIAENESASADLVIEGLSDAVQDKNTKAIILNINSPGGSPVQAANVYDEIHRLKAEHPAIPIYSVVGDICASGAYYIAAATDKIYVNQASIIGSIGVIMNGFGFVEVLKKLGVERRLLTAGSHKALMDPFSPVNKEEIRHMQRLINEVHNQFIDAVKTGRGERLVESPDMFSGLVWTGTEGVKLGLADGFGSVKTVAKDIIGTEKTVNFTPKDRILDRLVGRFAASFGHALGAMTGRLSLQ